MANTRSLSLISRRNGEERIVIQCVVLQPVALLGGRRERVGVGVGVGVGSGEVEAFLQLTANNDNTAIIITKIFKMFF